MEIKIQLPGVNVANESLSFPSQGSQYEGMRGDLLEISDVAKEVFQLADNVLGFGLTEKMVSGSAE